MRNGQTKQIIISSQIFLLIALAALSVAIHRTALLSEACGVGNLKLWDAIYAATFFAILLVWLISIALALLGIKNRTYITIQEEITYNVAAFFFTPLSFLALQFIFPITLH